MRSPVRLVRTEQLDQRLAESIAGYRARLAEVREKHGEAHAQRWIVAQDLLRETPPPVRAGRVRPLLDPPPECQRFLPAAQAAASGTRGIELDELTRTSLRAYWAWYLLLETRVLRLCDAIRWACIEEDPLRHPLLHLGFRYSMLLRDWHQQQKLPWLPERPPSGLTLARTLTRTLDKCNEPPERESMP